MTRRSMLVSLAVIAAIAVAVPAIAQVDDQGENFKRISQELRKLAHKALKKSNKALKKAKQGTQGPAGQNGPAGQAGPPGGASTPAFAEAAGPESTNDDTQFVQLPGGPSVTVTVPQAAYGPPGTGFIEVAASTRVGDDAGGVSLYEDGAPMPNQSDVCADLLFVPPPPGEVLFSSIDGLGGLYGTPATPSGISCGNTGAPTPVIFQTSTGTHTYELQYIYCGCTPGNSATFSERRLWVTPLG